jgi:two-component system response regulator GlrR
MIDRDLPETVVLVEDDAGLRELLALRLGRLGYQVRAAECVADAIPLLESGPADAVLSDHTMPGASGLDLLAYVNCRRPELPFVLMSGDVTPEIEAAAWSHGAIGVVAKNDLSSRLHVLFPPTPSRLPTAA